MTTRYSWGNYFTCAGSAGNENHLYAGLAMNLLVFWYWVELEEARMSNTCLRSARRQRRGEVEGIYWRLPRPMVARRYN